MLQPSIKKMICLIALIFFVAAGVQITLFYQYAHNATQTRQSVDHTQRVINQIQLLASALNEAELAQLAFIITGLNQHLTPYETIALLPDKQADSLPTLNFNAIQSTIHNLRALLWSPVQQQRLRELTPLIQKKLDYLDETIELRQNLAIKTVITRISGANGKPLSDQIRAKTNAMIAYEQLMLELRSKQNVQADTRFIYFIIATLFICYGIIFFTILLIIRYFQRMRQAEELRHISDKNFRVAFENSPEAYTIFNETEGILDCNAAALALFDLSNKAQIISTPVTALWPEYQPDGVNSQQKAQEFLAIIKNMGHHRFEWACKKSNGAVFPVEAIITQATLYERPVLFAYWHDITERKKAEQSLRNSEMQLNLAVSGTSDGLWDWNIITGEVHYSVRFLEMLGYQENELPGNLSTFTNLLNPDDLSRVYQELDQHIIDHTPYSTEYRLKHKNGHYICCHAKGQAFWDENGTAIRMAGFISDITQQKEIERMKNEFISTISHELRTPLTSIQGSLALMRGETFGELPKTMKSMLEIAYRNSHRLLLLINDILDIDKMAAGQMHFNIAEESLSDLIQQAKEANQAYGEKYDVKIITTAFSPDVIIKVDAIRFIQVLSNLFSNAIKFSPAGDAITVSVTRTDDKVRITIEDNGPGIPDEFRSTIFNMFAQAASTVKEQKGGTGLGLYISKKIIERMGGEIGFTSEPTTPTQFWIELPQP